MTNPNPTFAAILHSSNVPCDFINDVDEDIESVCAVLKLPKDHIEIYRDRLLDYKYKDDEGLLQICKTYRELKRR